MTTLSLDALSDMPQRSNLRFLATALWREESVVALWLGGSLARGEGDAFSDVDLRVGVRPEALEAWQSQDFTTLFGGKVLANVRLTFGADTFLHHLMLTDGMIVDLLVQSAERPPYPETLIVLGCRDEMMGQRLAEIEPTPEPEEACAEGEAIREALVQFWINTHKHRKVLHRGLDLLVLIGIQMERALLQRLWYALDTGRDYGDGRQTTIHGLTRFTRTVMLARGAQALEISGAPLTNRAEIVRVIEQIRDAVSETGRLLADRLAFDYPNTLEKQVRQDWEAFLEQV